MASVGEAVFGGLRITEPQPRVLAAEHRFAKRRHDHLSAWKPRRGTSRSFGTL